MSIANDKRPGTFSEYVGQKGAVGYSTSVIKSGAHPSGLMISGMPGTGKTTLAHLYVKATLCENREPGSYEPCGECDSCKADIEQGGHPNVTYYRITEASAFKDVVSDLITMTKAVPQITHDNNRADNYRRFIIIDELQNCLSGNTKVLTKEGEVFISDESIIGKEVLCFNEDLNKWEYKKVIAHLPKHIEDTIEIQTTNGTIVCTKEHKIKTKNGWKQGKEISTLDKIQCPVNVDAENFILKWIKMVGLKTILKAMLKQGVENLQIMERYLYKKLG